VDIAEGRDKVQAFAQERGLPFTILLDESGSTANDYQVRGIPSSFFIDGQGVIQLRHAGALDEPLIDEYVEQILP
jgi:peroxiredoxin